MRRLRTVSLVVTIVTAVLGATITPAQATTTAWTDNSTPTPAFTTASADKPASPRGPLLWTPNSQYYSLATSYTALDRCIVVKEFGNIGYQTDDYMDTNKTVVMRWIQRPKLLGPTTMVQFYDHCGSGRTLKPLPSARVELTSAWTDNFEYWDSCGDCISVSVPWGISVTPTTVGRHFNWAYKTVETNTTTTDQFLITSTGTMATWSAQRYTERLIVEDLENPVYPKVKMTNELTRLVVHSGDRTHTFGPDALPKKSVTIW